MKTPPFCPSTGCIHHYHPQERLWYVRCGYFSTRLRGRVQRFRCRACGTKFSSQTFSLDYKVQRRVSYRRICAHLRSGAGIRDIARVLGIGEKVVRNRIQRLSRQAMAIHARLRETIRLQEDLACDGFESFTVSQYFPNNIHLLVGKSSQYLYAYDYAPLRRKGRMSEVQKKRREELEKLYTPEPRAVESSFSRIVDQCLRLVEVRKKRGICLVTDKKHDYQRCLLRRPELRRLRERGEFVHLRISSRRPRTGNNPLFSVNYFDREIRKDCANHVRETVQFSRNVCSCLDRLSIYLLYHNYEKPFRIGVREKERFVHAEIAGVNRENIEKELKTFYTRRRFLTRSCLSFSETRVWLRLIPTPPALHQERVPAYLWQ